MKKAFTVIFYFLISVFIGILWYYPVVPFLFYITLGESYVRDRMQGDLIEFYGIAGETPAGIERGYHISQEEIISVTVAKIGMYGFWIIPVLGIIYGLWRVLPYRHRFKNS